MKPQTSQSVEPAAAPAELPLALVPEPQIPEPSQRQLAQVGSTPADMLAALVARNAPMEQLAQFMALKERHEANEARKAYVAAMARAKADAPIITKDKTVSYQPRDKPRVEYDHATIGNVVGVVVPWLARFGFSHRWEVRQDQGRISVTCEITHDLGHRESVSLTASADDSGGKNPIQQIVSTTSYLERHTLLAACGLATRDQEDDDGRAGGANRGDEPAQPRQAPEKPPYTDEQFKKNLPAWTKLILEGGKDPASIIAKIESKATLNAEQKKTLNGLGLPAGGQS